MPHISHPRILLTGASGFLGTALVKAWVAEGKQVTSLGRGPATTLPGVTFIEADIARPGSLRAVLDKLRAEPHFDYIVHLAVSRHHKEFPEKALDMFYVNMAAAAELLDFARFTGVPNALFGSTGTVYSTDTKSEIKINRENAEKEFNFPSSYFSASKLFADVLCDLYRPYMKIATLRLYAPYGPGLKDRMLTDLVARVRENRPLTLPASGPGLSFAATYVDDVNAVVRRALAEGWNEAVNVAAPETWTIESCGRLIGELVGRDPVFERSKASSAPLMVPDISRLKALAPDLNFMGLRDGLKAMIAAG